MKRNIKPLTYLVHPDLMPTKEVQELIQKGHTVIEGFELQDKDLIIGPNCYRLSPATIDLIDIATKSTRASKYPSKKGKKDEESLAETQS